MNANEKILLASYIRANHLTKEAGAWNAAKNVADFGSYFIPGVGTARMGYDAFKDFRKGNWLAGAGNLVGAGLSLIPGAGGFAGKGVSMLGRLGAKGLSRVGAPALGNVVGKGLGTAGKGLTSFGNRIDAGVASAGKRLTGAVGQIPRVGGVGAKTMTGVGNFVNKNPVTTALTGGGGVIGLNMAQDGVNESKAVMAQTQQGMNNMLANMRRSPFVSNPMFAGGGQNMRIGF